MAVSEDEARRRGRLGYWTLGIVIVGIDARSVGEHGRWPWSRNDQAKIIDQLSKAGSRTILIDVLYTDHGVSNPEGDARLAYAIEKSGSVVLPILTEGRGADIQDGERLPITQTTLVDACACLDGKRRHSA